MLRTDLIFRYPDDPDWFAASVGLPAIQRIYGHNQGNEDQGTDDPESCSQPFSKLAPRSSPVEHIELRKSKLNIANFGYLLRAPKCLKTMIYEIGNTWAVSLSHHIRPHTLLIFCLTSARARAGFFSLHLPLLTLTHLTLADQLLVDRHQVLRHAVRTIGAEKQSRETFARSHARLFPIRSQRRNDAHVFLSIHLFEARSDRANLPVRSRAVTFERR